MIPPLVAKTYLFSFTFLFVQVLCIAQKHDYTYNYDEKQVPKYTLPSFFEEGQKKTRTTWEQKQRPKILQLFKDHVYGNPVVLDYELKNQIIEDYTPALSGTALRRQIKLSIKAQDATYSVLALVYVPANTPNAPLFLGYNYYGNYSITHDPKVIIGEHYSANKSMWHIFDHKPQAHSRGVRSYRWPLPEIIKRGYGLMTLCYNEVQPDTDDPKYEGFKEFLIKNKIKKPTEIDWGHIGVWSWWLSRCMDYIETDNQLQNNQVVLIGHSRLGKTALWTIAQDQRFAAVADNESGTLGHSLSRRAYGEHIARISDQYARWFSKNLRQYAHNEENMPVDQHMLLALAAPKPLYCGAAKGDQWADPKGAFLSLQAASEIFNLYNSDVNFPTEMPALHKPYHGKLQAFHYRDGEHDLSYYDWVEYLNWMDKVLKR